MWFLAVRHILFCAFESLFELHQEINEETAEKKMSGGDSDITAYSEFLSDKRNTDMTFGICSVGEKQKNCHRINSLYTAVYIQKNGT